MLGIRDGAERLDRLFFGYALNGPALWGSASARASPHFEPSFLLVCRDLVVLLLMICKKMLIMGDWI
jgi:hypothetical protein